MKSGQSSGFNSQSQSQIVRYLLLEKPKKDFIKENFIREEVVALVADVSNGATISLPS